MTESTSTQKPSPKPGRQVARWALPVGLLLVMGLAFLGFMAWRRTNPFPEWQPPGPYESPDFPDTQRRVLALVASLKEESAQESLQRLSRVEQYYWPGPLGETPASDCRYPIESIHGERDLEHVLSNRRVFKVAKELQALPSAEAAARLGSELAEAAAAYQEAAARYIETNGKHYLPGATVVCGPSFYISDAPDGSPTLLGLRFKVLALCFLAGQLGLEGCSEEVVRTAVVARQQYGALSLSKEHHLVFNHEFLRTAGLYSRQCLASGLMGTARAKAREGLRGFEARTRTIAMPLFDSVSTPYDLHTRYGAPPFVDTRSGTFDCKILGELSDQDFDAILKAAKG